MRKQLELKNLAGASLFAAVCFGWACQAPTTTNTSVTTTTNSNATTGVNSINTNVSSVNSTGTSGMTIETKEPDVYQATVTLKFETTGMQNTASPPAITANVARNGDSRRMEFSLPGGEQLIYVDRGGKQFVISPNRKQYAELTKEALGFEIRRLLTPEQIVQQVRNFKGVEQVGEEKVGGRDAVRYRYGSTTNTQSKAGTVATESIVLVDKETSLPLRSSTVAQSQDGNVQGVQGLSLTTEMSNIRVSADPSLFAEPTDYKQVAPEEIKAQVNTIFSAAMLLMNQLLKSAQPPAAAATATPQN